MGRVFETVEILFESFDKISTKDEFKGKVRLIWKKKGGKKLSSNRMQNICFGLWTRIYDIDLSKEEEVNLAEQQFSKLKKISSEDYFFVHWNKTKYATLANLILGTKHKRFKLKVNTTEELETLISSWRSIGVLIEPQTLLNFLTDKIEWEKLHLDKKLIERCSNILGPYTAYNNAFGEFYERSNRLWMNKLSKMEIKEEIIKRSNKSRVIVSGKYPRDSQLALMFKKYHNAVCIVCGNKKDIEVSHKIPLNLGHDNYAFDLPFNMDLCCHSCHKRHEKNFDSEYQKTDDKRNFVKKIHEADVRNSPWTQYIDSKFYTVIEKPEIKYSGIMKCVKCLKRYRKVKLCKSCNHEVLPIEDAFFKIGT